jgi:hypothetical protein
MVRDLSRRSVFGVIAAPFITPALANMDADPPKGSDSVQKFGARGDGVSDDTDALARAHSSGDPVFYPRTSAFYKISHVLPLKASVGSNGAAIHMVGADGTHPKTIFRVTGNTRPIEISGFVLDGGYKGGTQGEWSHGIDLSGAKNVVVRGNTIQNIYGDCVSLGSANAKIATTNIRIRENKLLNPRRCNVAVICGDDVVIEDNTCVNKSDYVSGIDLEPDPNGFDYVRHVSISRNRFTAKKFILAGVNNGIANIGLSIIENEGQASAFFHGWENALLHNVTIRQNRFAATSPKGIMLNLEVVKGGDVSDNVDETACGNGYRSVNLRDCELSLAGNRFCS